MDEIIGKWKITEMQEWDLDYIDEQGPGFFEFEDIDQGFFMFGRVEGDIDYRVSKNGKKPRIEYSWLGDEEMENSNGRGWFEFVNENELYGMFFFHQGDDSWVKASRIE